MALISTVASNIRTFCNVSSKPNWCCGWRGILQRVPGTKNRFAISSLASKETPFSLAGEELGVKAREIRDGGMAEQVRDLVERGGALGGLHVVGDPGGSRREVIFPAMRKGEEKRQGGPGPLARAEMVLRACGRVTGFAG
jgi:hypothetical protein